MKRITRVVERKYWLNKKTGQQVSIYGAVPYTSDAERDDWEIVTKGYTWEWHDGKIGGFATPPAQTLEEAISYMEKVNSR